MIHGGDAVNPLPPIGTMEGVTPPRSLTKAPLDAVELASLLAELRPGSIAVEELSGGMFNIAYAVEGPGFRGVLKAAPPAAAPVLTYEHDLVEAELDFFDRARGLPTPAVRGRSLGRERPAFLMDRLDGKPVNECTLTAAQRDAVRSELGRGLAALRDAEGEAFGYLRPDGSFRADSWDVAFGQMVDAVIVDARTWNVRLPGSVRRLPSLLSRARRLLAAVERPTLTHFDLWDGNLFVVTEGDGARLSGVIDGERRFWGDPLAEFASTSLFGDAEGDVALLAGMAEAGVRVVFTPDVRARLALYRAYLSLIMIVEAAPRGHRGMKAWLTSRFARAQFDRQAASAHDALAVLDM